MQMDDGRVVSNVICQALGNTDITVYGDGRQTRSFCFVTDLVAGLMRLAACREPGESPVNLGNPVELTVADLVDMVVRMTGTRSRIVRRPLPVDDPRRRRPDIGLAERLLDWRPKVTLAEGLERTIAYFADEMQADLGPRQPDTEDARVAG